ncbi:MAG: flavodoxin family protein [Elusimicrobiota bacterium]
MDIELTDKILVINGSPKKDGNSSLLVEWFTEGARSQGAIVETIRAVSLTYRSNGCTSCRQCQKLPGYGCVIEDDAKSVLEAMLKADIIVMATPLYFFSASAQIKIIFDRMFSLFKWNNDAGTFETPLKGKTFVLIASAYEELGMDALEIPFELTAAYSGMRFKSLLVPNAGVSGNLKGRSDIRQKAIDFGRDVSLK